MPNHCLPVGEGALDEKRRNEKGKDRSIFHDTRELKVALHASVREFVRAEGWYSDFTAPKSAVKLK